VAVSRARRRAAPDGGPSFPRYRVSLAPGPGRTAGKRPATPGAAGPGRFTRAAARSRHRLPGRGPAASWAVGRPRPAHRLSRTGCA